jgi:hypothetical protein
MLSTISEELLKIKIVRDFKKFNKPNLNIPQKKSIFKSQKYLNLLTLIRNTWYYTVPFPHTNKLVISNLDNIYINLLYEVSKLDNIEVIEIPRASYMYIENNQLLTKTFTVGDFRGDTLQFIKDNKNIYIFYIYQIGQNNARWYMREDKDRLKTIRQKERKEKLKKIEIL